MFQSYLALLSIIFALILPHANSMGRTGMPDRKTVAVKGVPFCAFILLVTFDPETSQRQLYALMESDKVNEQNLLTLFKTLSTCYSKPVSLEIWVKTDVSQLAEIATGRGCGECGVGIREEHQWGYYRRSEQVELFRYNPRFPEPWIRTVVLRGVE